MNFKRLFLKVVLFPFVLLRSSALLLIGVGSFMFTLIQLHLTVLYRQLYPVRNIRAKIESKHEIVHFLFAIVVIVFTNVYGTLVFQYEDSGEIVLGELATSPYPYLHQCIPQIAWAQYDIAAIITVIASIIYFGALMVDEPLDARYVIFQDTTTTLRSNKFLIGTKSLSLAESEQMAKFCHATSRWFNPLVLAYMLMQDAFLYFNVWYHDVYRFNVTCILYWFGSFALFEFYLIYSLFASVLYIIVACRIIRIRQMSIVQELLQINRKLSSRKPKSLSDLLFQWLRFKRLNVTLLDICKHIAAYSRVLTPRLSIILPDYISVQCYFLFIYLYAPMSFTLRLYFLLFIIEFYLLQFSIIRECASVDKVNRTIEKQLAHFYVNFSKANGFCLMKNCKSNILKTETLQTARRFRSYGFKVIGNYRISNKTYNALISYIIAFFMFIRKYS